MTIYLTGMCYSGKTTIGRLLGGALGKKWLDSRDIFLHAHGISEVEYLRIYGTELFKEAERYALGKDFEDCVVSLPGSCMYYSQEMEKICNKHHVIWLNAGIETIYMRQQADPMIRPIVYSPGITSFGDLYYSRKPLYSEYSNITISNSEMYSPEEIVEIIKRELGLNRIGR